MSLIDTLLEKNLLPDALIRFGIRQRLDALLRDKRPMDIGARQTALNEHIEGLKMSPIAIETDAANEQHYEVPTQFFQYCLGKHLKYSSGWWDDNTKSLDDAEAAMLAITCERAELRDGQRILELGCGWGSLSLWMAAHYPNSQITSVSNSRTQKEFIDGEAAKRGLKNLTIVTANMNSYAGEGTGVFDRVVSVEMFEHMKNYRELLHRVASWMKLGGKLFVHIFTHPDIAYHFEAKNENEWLARHFFAGGQMPSHDLLLHFQDDLRIEQQWAVNGTHYEKTSNAWLANMDANHNAILPLLARTYGESEAMKWWARWRVFYMACAELWGYRGGNDWLVSHYRFVKP
ncbi:MAG: cyclopropane-fatty-acyl-phospholipid synthase family protein [Verrucomicrobia bacterium]|nr:cyclopropane-fatty-acyl-phospholipid synthase family protein [Verrucomicrobiota bacterium]